MGPNVLLVVMDTARADAFEPYGAATGSTPAVAQLARAGLVQRHAYAPASWTVPSHASMLTGLLPRDMGLTQAPGGTPHGVRSVMETLQNHLLPEQLRRAGWHTAGISANGWIAEHSGFATGFDRWEEPMADRTGGRLHPVADRLGWYAQGLRAHVDDGARAAEEILRDWLRDVTGRQPFFWFVNLVECHSPYLPPRPYNDLSPLGRLRAADEARRYLTFTGILRASAGGVEIPGGAIERMRHLYARSVRSMDDWLARVLEAMDKGGVLDDTLVIVTSDHGENLGEGQMIGHALSLDERLIRIPFVSSHPLGLEPDHVLSLTDLPRLVADLVDLQDHPWGDGDLRSPTAVAQLDPMGGEAHPGLLEWVRDWGLDGEGTRRLTWPATAATDGRWKLVRRNDEERLFDLVSDPLELRPLAVAAGAGVEPALMSSVTRLRAAVDAATEPRPVPGLSSPARVAPEASAEELERIRRQMELLGYL
ncbi:MAG: sulfatase-like hydrolase/transferase [Acidimicrobiales bacterium]